MSRSTSTMFSEMSSTINHGVYWQSKMGLLEFNIRELQNFGTDP